MSKQAGGTGDAELADALLRMGPVSAPCRGQRSALTNLMIKRGLVTVSWMDMRHYVLTRTAAGNSIAKALFRQRGETVDGESK